MILLREPCAETVATFLAAQRACAFTYGAPGATAMTPPPGFVVDHTRVAIGTGETAFQQARAALQRWEQFRLGWLEARSPAATIQPGDAVAVIARAGSLWWLNACRIIYVIDEQQPSRRYGYAYGTMPDHVASGEERFLVECNPADQVVWYDILAFSRPQRLLARLGYPCMRRMQKQFGRDSAAAMVKAVRGAESGR